MTQNGTGRNPFDTANWLERSNMLFGDYRNNLAQTLGILQMVGGAGGKMTVSNKEMNIQMAGVLAQLTVAAAGAAQYCLTMHLTNPDFGREEPLKIEEMMATPEPIHVRPKGGDRLARMRALIENEPMEEADPMEGVALEDEDE